MLLLFGLVHNVGPDSPYGNDTRRVLCICRSFFNICPLPPAQPTNLSTHVIYIKICFVVR